MTERQHLLHTNGVRDIATAERWMRVYNSEQGWHWRWHVDRHLVATDGRVFCGNRWTYPLILTRGTSTARISTEMFEKLWREGIAAEVAFSNPE